MIRCIIVEDQLPAQEILKKFIGQIGNIELIATFSNPMHALDFLQSETVDLVFLDIHLPIISGIEFLKILEPNCKVILTTAFEKYAIESYEYQVTDYLLKPFSFERFLKAVSKFTNERTESAKPEISLGSKILFIKNGHDYIKVDTNDIIFIKSEADYTEIHTFEKRYLTSQPLRFWLEKLENYNFTQIHRSYAINADKILKISGNRVIFGEEINVPIGRTFKESFVKKYLN